MLFFCEFAPPGCRWMSQDGRYTAAPVFYTTIWNARVFLRCISAPAQSRKDDITACTWMVMPLDVAESYYRQALLRVSLPQFYVSFWKTGATVQCRCRALVRSTRNKLVIGCIDPSSANISFVLNPVPYNCLQISR